MQDEDQTGPPVSYVLGWTEKFRLTEENIGHRLGIMGARHDFQLQRCLAIGLILSTIYISSQAQDTTGFLSIDCGTSGTYTDNVTTLTWEGDGNYTRTGTSGEIPIQVNVSYNSEALQTFRYFPDQRSKHCYELRTTTANISYNLRAMFLHGGSPELSLPIKFDVYVNDTVWATMGYQTDDTSNTLDTPRVLDGIFFSPGYLTHFCLVPDTGVPFISSLELRQLDPDGIMYSINGDNPWYLSAYSRWNCGPPGTSPDTVRYPGDPFDRLWHTEAPVANATATTGTASNGTSSSVNSVPQTVMQDAWLNDGPNSSFGVTNLNIGLENSYIAVYVEEIEPNSSSRSFDISLNGNAKTVTAGSEAFLAKYENFPLSSSNSLTFTASPNSTLGPIVNAIEVYFQREFRTSATAAQDGVRHTSYGIARHDSDMAWPVSFNLITWQGDPCYPVAWEWVNCTSDVPAKIEKLLLSDYGINATIPSSISDLQSLTQIDLSRNSLFGVIPDSLASLPNLTILSLNDNQLSGQVPLSLMQKLGLSFNFSGNNLLTTNPTTKKNSNVGVIIGSIVGGIVGVGLAVYCVKWYFSSRKRKSHQNHPYNDVEIELPGHWWSGKKGKLDEKSKEDEFLDTFPNMPRRYSIKELDVATLGFTKELGSGGFGTVYEGLLLDGSKIAVKKLQRSKGTKDFRAELATLGSIHHVNLVRLRGFCTEGVENMLVYEYMPNGSLDRWLFSNATEPESSALFPSTNLLDWGTRFKIALGTARGLAYLHEECSERIIHLDIKPQNILLDKDFNPKVADFGLSKLVDRSISMVVTTMRGTPGYLAPEWLLQAAVTERTDVYSYGIVLLELVAGRKALDLSMAQDSKQRYLPAWLLHCVMQADVLDIVDPRLDVKHNEEEQIARVTHIALQCIQEEMMCRPSMVVVVQMLEGLVGVPDLQMDTLSTRYRFATSIDSDLSSQKSFDGFTRSSTRSLNRSVFTDQGLTTSTAKSSSSTGSSSFNIRSESM